MAEPLIEKHHGDSFEDTDTTLVSDAHTTEDQTGWGAPRDEVIAHTNL